jgi:predicted anti-sigma-YlaC factor YlaD
MNTETEEAPDRELVRLAVDLVATARNAAVTYLNSHLRECSEFRAMVASKFATPEAAVASIEATLMVALQPRIFELIRACENDPAVDRKRLFELAAELGESVGVGGFANKA